MEEQVKELLARQGIEYNRPEGQGGVYIDGFLVIIVRDDIQLHTFLSGILQTIRALTNHIKLS